jgi:hypothetical protein
VAKIVIVPAPDKTDYENITFTGFKDVDRGGSTVVEQATLDPKLKGSNPAAACVGSGKYCYYFYC